MSLEPLHTDGLSAELEQTTGVIAVRFTGSADLHTQQQLREFLKDLHGEAVRVRARSVQVDMARLEFMNSSCFKAFITWITTIQQLTPAQNYKVTFISDERVHWQKRSLHALRCFAADLVTVRTLGQS